MKPNDSNFTNTTFNSILLTGIVFLFTLPGISQELSYEITGNYKRAVKTEELRNARYISDFIVGYPSSWIDHYDSVEIVISLDGKIVRPRSANDSLTTEQKNILKALQPGANIDITINYQTRVAGSVRFEKRKIEISVTVIPDIEAEYLGGYEKLSAYINEQVIKKIPVSKTKKFQPLLVLFSVTENGDVINVKISKSCGDPKIDKLAVDAITKLSKWKPAEWPKGVRIQQEFKFSVGESGC